ncbi:class II aldolase/adducin family protein [Ornithinimicrobium humiphilum]|uniref:L-fuculose-phosphate aldolase n=1 Tax=Ornithinimicrobium humiphilum TaxID=125288 RepID=A0A543KRS9_9MICO|nr:class II aldolase/adducin family protein [Ornithinimicrobium humiphilum]TQM97771.1 L-fuculose-phosphate aldolase [Ornithinimicrobium humiphilum]
MAYEEERELALTACRAMAAQGLGTGIGGHVSIRIPGKELYWTNRLSKTFEEMQLDDIVLLDFEGRSADPEVIVSPGIDFHHGIYKLRPDVNAIVHTHGFWITAQAALGREPRVLHNMATYFKGRTAIAPDDEIASIAPSLKDGDVAIIIPWHGSITLGKDIAEAAALHHTLDYVARLDVTAPADAPEMPEEHAEAVRVLLAKADYLNLTWGLLQRKAARAFDGTFTTPLVAP